MKALKRKRVVLGMDDRIPSKLAASLLRNQGFEVFPLHLSIDLQSVGEDPSDFPSAFSVSVIADIETFCETLGISLTVKDVTQESLARIYDPLWMATLSALPDAPQIRWVSQILLPKLREFAHEIGADSVATGHFAQIREAIYRYPERSYDQSGSFSRVNRSELDSLLLPIGEISPALIVRLGTETGLLKKPEEGDGPKDGELALFESQQTRPRFHFTPELLGKPSVQKRAPGYFPPGLTGNFSDLKVTRAFLKNLSFVDGNQNGKVPGYREKRLEYEALPPLTRSSVSGEARVLVYPGNLAEVSFTSGEALLARGQEIMFYEGSRLVGAGRVAETRQKS